MTGKHLYIIQSDKTGTFKIGRANSPIERLDQLQTGSPYKLKLLLVLFNQGYKEKELHKLLAKYRTQGEWFKEEAISLLPDEIYEQLDLELINLPWWKHE